MGGTEEKRSRYNYATIIHFFFVISLILYSAPLIIVIFCMIKSSFFGQHYDFIKHFALSYEPDSIWRSSIANILMPLLTSISISLLKPSTESVNKEVKIPIFSMIMGFILLMFVGLGIACDQIVIGSKESLSGYTTKVYEVFHTITSSSIKEYLTFFAILFGISASKAKE